MSNLTNTKKLLALYEGIRRPIDFDNEDDIAAVRDILLALKNAYPELTAINIAEAYSDYRKITDTNKAQTKNKKQ